METLTSAINVQVDARDKEQATNILKDLGIKNLIRENAKDYFMNTIVETEEGPIGPLVDTVDQEKKRRILWLYNK